MTVSVSSSSLSAKSTTSQVISVKSTDTLNSFESTWARCKSMSHCKRHKSTLCRGIGTIAVRSATSAGRWRPQLRNSKALPSLVWWKSPISLLGMQPALAGGRSTNLLCLRYEIALLRVRPMPTTLLNTCVVAEYGRGSSTRMAGRHTSLVCQFHLQDRRVGQLALERWPTTDDPCPVKGGPAPQSRLVPTLRHYPRCTSGIDDPSIHVRWGGRRAITSLKSPLTIFS